MQIEMTMKLPAEVKKEGKWYISRCSILDVYSQGETKNKAIKNLVEALTAFLVSCYERKTLDAVLKECGFKAIHKPAIKKPFPKKFSSINVPIPFLISPSHLAPCHP